MKNRLWSVVLFQCCFAIVINAGLYYLFPFDNETGFLALISVIPILCILIIVSVQLLKGEIIKRRIFRISYQLLIYVAITVISVKLFPFRQNGSISEIYDRCKFVVKNPQVISEENILLDPTNIINYERILAARKKIKRQIDPEIYFIAKYSSSENNYSPKDEYVMYFKNDSLFSSKKGLEITKKDNYWVIHDAYINKQIEYFFIRSKSEDYIFMKDFKGDYNINSSNKIYYVDQSSVYVRIHNLTTQKDYFRFERKGVYRILNIFLQ